MNANKRKLNFTAKLPPMTMVEPIIDNKITENTLQSSNKDNTQEIKKKKKKTPKRCQIKGCRKKLSLCTAFDCRCDKKFCRITYMEPKIIIVHLIIKLFIDKNLVDRAGLGGWIADKVGDRV